MDRADREIAMLEALAAKGLPTAAVVGKTSVHGQPAIIFERYPGSSADIVRNRSVVDDRLLSEASVASLSRIRAVMLETPVAVDRLNLLIRADGAFVLSDPGAVWEGRPPPQDQVALIDLLLAAAEAKLGRP
ncbi:hypothetical protein FFK22_024420 [Mycobacterium sp. KBS0706]|uniref:hypothetical protein n=1 Tax=Mycobacterium sp. KBS0706 TaxID=2578109 RepID=UPI00110F7B49|nr:hypothetical protein [Mycobacterium sp. KBS0706]TSD86076.1 hypothetical protein FFK22_024420 [Mycobacterium sp. KBS0706]